MCFEAMRWAIKKTLPHMQKIVLIVLADCKNHETGDCFPSFDFLADACGMSRRSVIRQVNWLVEQGYIAIEKSEQKGVNLNNQYSLIMDSGSDRESLGVVTESHQGSDRESLGVVTESHPNQEYITYSPLRAREAVDNFSVEGDMQQCFDWARAHPFWSDVVTSLSKFLLLYNANAPNGVRSQFEKHNENISENESGFKSAGAMTGGGNRKNYHRLSLVERVRAANGRPIDEWSKEA